MASTNGRICQYAPDAVVGIASGPGYGEVLVTIQRDGVTCYNSDDQTRQRSWAISPGSRWSFVTGAVWDPASQRFYCAVSAAGGQQLISWPDEVGRGTLEKVADSVVLPGRVHSLHLLTPKLGAPADAATESPDLAAATSSDPGAFGSAAAAPMDVDAPAEPSSSGVGSGPAVGSGVVVVFQNGAIVPAEQLGGGGGGGGGAGAVRDRSRALAVASSGEGRLLAVWRGLREEQASWWAETYSIQGGSLHSDSVLRLPPPGEHAEVTAAARAGGALTLLWSDGTWQVYDVSRFGGDASVEEVRRWGPKLSRRVAGFALPLAPTHSTAHAGSNGILANGPVASAAKLNAATPIAGEGKAASKKSAKKRKATTAPEDGPTLPNGPSAAASPAPLADPDSASEPSPFPPAARPCLILPLQQKDAICLVGWSASGGPASSSSSAAGTGGNSEEGASGPDGGAGVRCRPVRIAVLDTVGGAVQSTMEVGQPRELTAGLYGLQAAVVRGEEADSQQLAVLAAGSVYLEDLQVQPVTMLSLLGALDLNSSNPAAAAARVVFHEEEFGKARLPVRSQAAWWGPLQQALSELQPSPDRPFTRVDPRVVAEAVNAAGPDEGLKFERAAWDRVGQLKDRRESTDFANGLLEWCRGGGRGKRLSRELHCRVVSALAERHHWAALGLLLRGHPLPPLARVRGLVPALLEADQYHLLALLLHKGEGLTHEDVAAVLQRALSPGQLSFKGRRRFTESVSKAAYGVAKRAEDLQTASTAATPAAAKPAAQAPSPAATSAAPSEKAPGSKPTKTRRKQRPTNGDLSMEDAHPTTPPPTSSTPPSTGANPPSGTLPELDASELAARAKATLAKRVSAAESATLAAECAEAGLRGFTDSQLSLHSLLSGRGVSAEARARALRGLSPLQAARLLEYTLQWVEHYLDTFAFASEPASVTLPEPLAVPRLEAVLDWAAAIIDAQLPKLSLTLATLSRQLPSLTATTAPALAPEFPAPTIPALEVTTTQLEVAAAAAVAGGDAEEAPKLTKAERKAARAAAKAAKKAAAGATAMQIDVDATGQPAEAAAAQPPLVEEAHSMGREEEASGVGPGGLADGKSAAVSGVQGLAAGEQQLDVKTFGEMVLRYKKVVARHQRAVRDVGPLLGMLKHLKSGAPLPQPGLQPISSLYSVEVFDFGVR